MELISWSNSAHSASSCRKLCIGKILVIPIAMINWDHCNPGGWWVCLYIPRQDFVLRVIILWRSRLPCLSKTGPIVGLYVSLFGSLSLVWHCLDILCYQYSTFNPVEPFWNSTGWRLPRRRQDSSPCWRPRGSLARVSSLPGAKVVCWRQDPREYKKMRLLWIHFKIRVGNKCDLCDPFQGRIYFLSQLIT